MAIRETIIVDVAEVDVTDDYRVELRQEKKRTMYTSQQARDLALELVEAAERLDSEISAEMEDLGARLERDTLRTPEGERVL